jgi:hypothetical protein
MPAIRLNEVIPWLAFARNNHRPALALVWHGVQLFGVVDHHPLALLWAHNHGVASGVGTSRYTIPPSQYRLPFWVVCGDKLVAATAARAA